MPDPKGCRRGSGEPVRKELTRTLEPKGKLDTMATRTGTAVSASANVAVVNGPEDDVADWYALDWRAAEDDVRRLRQRIFTASQAGDSKRVRNLQKVAAPRGALSYARFSREELEGRFLGLMAYLDPKGEGDNSMSGKQRSCPGVWGEALWDPRDMAKAGLPVSQSPEGATARPPERRLRPAPHPAPVSSAGRCNLRDAERFPMRVFEEMNVEPKSRYHV